MRSLRKAVVTMAGAALILGCGISSLNIPALMATTAPSATSVAANPVSTAAPTETPVVSTPTEPPVTFTPIPTLTSTPAPGGTSISYQNVTLTLPGSLGTGTTNSTSTSAEFPYINPSLGDMPEHIQLEITGYPILGTLLPPQIMLFPAAQYAGYSDYTRQLIGALQTTQYYDGQPLPAGLPDGAFNAHVGSVQFAGGHGIRYLTQFDQAPLPVNNRELIYFFHGLTDTGNYYVEAVLPVQAAFLAPDENPGSPLPANGIPFSMDNLDTYFQQVADKLNATPPDDFTPSLSALDALIQSIQVSAAQ